MPNERIEREGSLVRRRSCAKTVCLEVEGWMDDPCKGIQRTRETAPLMPVVRRLRRFGGVFMPWLPIYATSDDFRVVLEWLNLDPEIAFIVSNGPRRWIASRTLTALSEARYCLWHIPSGPLPLMPVDHRNPPGLVPDAWQGWEELRTGADPSTPYFGLGHPGVIWLNVRLGGRQNADSVGLSSFEWIGNYYRMIGSPAPEVTERWWASIRKRVKKVAIRVPRGGIATAGQPEIWAFPEACARFHSGRIGENNP